MSPKNHRSTKKYERIYLYIFVFNFLVQFSLNCPITVFSLPGFDFGTNVILPLVDGKVFIAYIVTKVAFHNVQVLLHKLIHSALQLYTAGATWDCSSPRAILRSTNVELERNQIPPKY